MPISVICGGQFGSEGKGKVAHFFAKKLNAKAAIRVGGPNSGHTVIQSNGVPMILKQLPTAAILPNIHCVISTGSYINVKILLEEIKKTNITEELLHIDPYAVIIKDSDILAESEGGLKKTIGSTGSGTGAALLNRIQRKNDILFAKDSSDLAKYLTDTKAVLRKWLSENDRIIIEGTQGFGLSVLHSYYYPFVTSRDTSAAAFVSEVGLSPLDVDEVIMVIRAFPIRVAGNSGPLPKEITWDFVTDYSGSAEPIIEYTSVSQKVRRVAEFDEEVVKKAIEVNKPTKIVLNHCDYFDKSNSNIVLEKIKKIESLIGCRIDFYGTNRLDISEVKSK